MPAIPTAPTYHPAYGYLRETLGAYPGATIVAQPDVERGLRDVAKQETANLLASARVIDAIFGSNDDCALGALAALEAAGRSDVLVVGYDAALEALTAMAGGIPRDSLTGN